MRRFQLVQDVSDAIDRKVEAVRAYGSQRQHVAWEEAVRGLATYRAATALGRGQAEVFQVLQLRL